MHTILEDEVEIEEGVCYTLTSWTDIDRIQNGNNCIQEGIIYVEAQTFQHPIPEGSYIEQDWIAQWEGSSEMLDQPVSLVYQLHVDDDVLQGEFVTVYFPDCRIPFEAIPCR